MNTGEYLDFNDSLSHENEVLVLGEFDLVRVVSNTVTDHVETVYDLVVEGNRNYVIEGLGLVHNGGKRSGAGTVALPIWHNDILDFLDMQTEHGDLRAKAYDVFPQLTVPDIFMERDKAQARWITFCPFEVRTKLGIDVRGLYGPEFEEAYLKIEAAVDAGRLKVFRIFPSAREITKIFMRTQFETGLPYIAFIDEINRTNPNKSAGYITCVNLCTESFSNVVADEYGHVCNLASINLGSISDFTELAKIAKVACRVLYYGISLTAAPDPITKAHNNKYRTIGIGIMGLHDYLARERYTYKNLDLISKIAECIEYNAAIESTVLAKKFGSFDAFSNSEWKNGGMVSLFKGRSKGEYDWDELQKMIDANGMRNSQLTSPAPTTSCHSLDDEITTVNGLVTMRELLINEELTEERLHLMEPCWIALDIPVYIPNTLGGISSVENIWWNGVQPTVDIEFEDGVTYSFTENHKLLVQLSDRQELIMVKDITADMEIVDHLMTRTNLES